MPLIGIAPSRTFERQLSAAFKASWAVNIFLLAAKIFAFVSSHSKAILASLADSGVDLASQLVLAVTEYTIKQHSPSYPVGRARLEALGVLGCACIMMVASLEVIQLSAFDLLHGFKGDRIVVHLGPADWLVLAVGTVSKFVLYLVCVRLRGRSDSMGALAEDHLNDFVSNVAAIAVAVVAVLWRRGWWVDPAGGILISVGIIWRWILVTNEQVQKIVGHAAPESFTQELEILAVQFYEGLVVDHIRAYYFGARYNVELDIILPAAMSVSESHDIATGLQQKIEDMDEVERAFVHVDYTTRDVLEHKVERALLLGHTEASRVVAPPAGLQLL